jgi:hypothetical protein
MKTLKEFTVGDMIKALEKLDPALPIYDHYYDAEENAEVWFNVIKPTPKKQTIYLTARKEGRKLIAQWTDEKTSGQVVEQKNIVILYPPDKHAIELG